MTPHEAVVRAGSAAMASYVIVSGQFRLVAPKSRHNQSKVHWYKRFGDTMDNALSEGLMDGHEDDKRAPFTMDLAVLGPCEMFGAFEALCGKTYSYGLSCDSGGVLLVLHRADVQRLFSEAGVSRRIFDAGLVAAESRAARTHAASSILSAMSPKRVGPVVHFCSVLS